MGVLLFMPTPLQATAIEELRQQAEQLERKQQWYRACDLYGQLLNKDRSSREVKERYLHCLRHIHQIRRHRDSTYLQKVLSLPTSQALNLYGEVLTKLQSSYADRDKVQAGRLFLNGLEEFTQALADETFRQEHLPGALETDLAAFRRHVVETWQGREVRDEREARALVREVSLAAQRILGLKATVAVLEFACGACNALDEYTVYLTPSQLDEEKAALDGEFVGVGIEVEIKDNQLVIFHVAPGSPAALAGIKEQDRIVTIGKKQTDRLPLHAAVELLKGEAGSAIELEVVSQGAMMARAVKLVRQSLQMPTLLDYRMMTEAIGYIQLSGFQRSTSQELEDAILRLRTDGMKALVLDLRGNPGGLFRVAVQVAERFLADGVIVSTHSQLRAFNRIYESHGGQGALDIPLLILVDGDTASAAEVVAGSLKENQRATLVGQPTFGKGSIQCVFQLSAAPAGIRITLARYFGPRGQSFQGMGITPHILVERTAMTFMKDSQLEIALQEAGRLLAMRP